MNEETKNTKTRNIILILIVAIMLIIPTKSFAESWADYFAYNYFYYNRSVYTTIGLSYGGKYNLTGTTQLYCIGYKYALGNYSQRYYVQARVRITGNKAEYWYYNSHSDGFYGYKTSGTSSSREIGIMGGILASNPGGGYSYRYKSNGSYTYRQRTIYYYINKFLGFNSGLSNLWYKSSNNNWGWNSSVMSDLYYASSNLDVAQISTTQSTYNINSGTKVIGPLKVVYTGNTITPSNISVSNGIGFKVYDNASGSGTPLTEIKSGSNFYIILDSPWQISGSDVVTKSITINVKGKSTDVYYADIYFLWNSTYNQPLIATTTGWANAGSSSSVTINVKVQPVSDFSITKVDSVTGEKLAGAKFCIMTNNSTYVKVRKCTDKNGNVIKGEYSYAGTVQDYDNGETSNATSWTGGDWLSHPLLRNGKAWSDGTYTVFETNEDGELIIKDMKVGTTFYLIECGIPDGYNKSDQTYSSWGQLYTSQGRIQYGFYIGTYTVEGETNQSNNQVIVKNVPPKEINITKKDGISGTAISGAEFKLYDTKTKQFLTVTKNSSGIYVPSSGTNTTIKTDSSGNFVVQNYTTYVDTDYGYELWETGAPSAYSLSEQAGYKEIHNTGQYGILIQSGIKRGCVKTATNTKLGELTIYKQDSENRNTSEEAIKLKGAMFKLRYTTNDSDDNWISIDENGDYIYTSTYNHAAVFKTNSNGSVTLKKIKYGTYQIYEVADDITETGYGEESIPTDLYTYDSNLNTAGKNKHDFIREEITVYPVGKVTLTSVNESDGAEHAYTYKLDQQSNYNSSYGAMLGTVPLSSSSQGITVKNKPSDECELIIKKQDLFDNTPLRAGFKIYVSNSGWLAETTSGYIYNSSFDNATVFKLGEEGTGDDDDSVPGGTYENIDDSSIEENTSALENDEDAEYGAGIRIQGLKSGIKYTVYEVEAPKDYYLECQEGYTTAYGGVVKCKTITINNGCTATITVTNVKTINITGYVWEETPRY